MAKVDIISGFLGAGKTTFIKKMIDEVFSGEKIVLIENEYGEVGIDGGFLKDAGIEITEMNSGCICCTLVGDFDKSLKEVIEKYSPDRIIIEPSGVGKLSDVMNAVKGVGRTHDIDVNALVTVVNAKKVAKQMKAFGEFFNNQIEYATTVVLSRTQDMTDEKLDEAVGKLQSLNSKAAIITTPWTEIKGEQILKVIEQSSSLEDEMMREAVAQSEKDAIEHEHEHHHDHEHEGHEQHHDHEGHEHDHDHEGHEHHHDHEGHEHHHDHEGHEHHHDHEGHEHHHDHEEHEHHHDHEHHHHHADEVFTSWGRETPHKFERAKIEAILKSFAESDEYGEILRAKGMVEDVAGGWIYFDMVPGEYELRDGEPDYTGRLCVIGTDIEEHRLDELFGL